MSKVRTRTSTSVRNITVPPLNPRQATLLFLLRAFCGEYLPDVEVYFAKIPEYGLADRRRRRIFLATNQPVDREGFVLGSGSDFLYALNGDVWKRLRLKDGEQYFVTLLHEIRHFTIRWTPSPEFVKAKRRLEKEYPNDLQMQHYEAGSYLRKPRDEEAWFGKMDAFESWLVGNQVEEHFLVDKWAIREFKRKRREIRRALREEGVWCRDAMKFSL